MQLCVRVFCVCVCVCVCHRPPDAPLPADLTCPVNTTLLTELLNLGAANITGGVTTGPNADQRDMIYYAECAAEAPRLWPDFNGADTRTHTHTLWLCQDHCMHVKWKRHML